MSDFIFVRSLPSLSWFNFICYLKVKEARIQEAMALFELAGFHLYSANSNSSNPSHFSPIIRDDYRSTESTPNSTHSTGAVLISSIDIPLCNNGVKPAASDAVSTGQQSPRYKSHSPTPGEVRMLIPDLACVGLSDELGVDHWGLKIVKLVAFPELIPSFHKSTSHPVTESSPEAHLINPHLSHSFRSSMFGDGDSDSDSSSGGDDGYFSHSPENVSVASLGSNTSRSYSDLPSVSHSPKLRRSPSKHYVGSITPPGLSPILPKLQPPLPYSISPFTEIHKSRSVLPKTDPRVPFFSFTRTLEGSSLTADVHLLATLFPPHERHMVICSGELDAADSHLEGDSSDECDEFDDLSSKSNSLKCLQIDLRRFGLGMYTLLLYLTIHLPVTY